ncbi:MAG: hypothetical protein FWD93_05060, partial [Coriobacteriia bacterium]|nr:hypothetical protein [Coriobacteriia bacterium]
KTTSDLEPTLPNANPTKHIEDTLDLTRQYNNLVERREDGTSASFIWDSALLASSSNGDVNTYLLDYLGSPLRFGSEAFAFDEFGQTLAGSFDTQPFGYTGYQQDSIANTWYAQARQYDSATGRFGAEDVVKGSVLAPQTQNPYTYCWNVPLAFVDLDGRTPRASGQYQLDSLVIDTVAGLWNNNIAGVKTGTEEPTIFPNIVMQSGTHTGNNTFVSTTFTNASGAVVSSGVQINGPQLPLGDSSAWSTVSITNGRPSIGIAAHCKATGLTGSRSLAAVPGGITTVQTVAGVKTDNTIVTFKETGNPWSFPALSVPAPAISLAEMTAFSTAMIAAIVAGLAYLQKGVLAALGAIPIFVPYNLEDMMWHFMPPTHDPNFILKRVVCPGQG